MFLSPEELSHLCHLRTGDNIKGSFSQDQLESKVHRVEGRPGFEWKEELRFTKRIRILKISSNVGLNITYSREP